MHHLNRENLPEVPESRAQGYVLDVFSNRTSAPVYRVSDATKEELQDLVCFYHTKLEEVKRTMDSTQTAVNDALGFENL